jgi:hypothetical protein
LLGTQSDKTLLQQAQAMEIGAFVNYICAGLGSGQTAGHADPRSSVRSADHERMLRARRRWNESD